MIKVWDKEKVIFEERKTFQSSNTDKTPIKVLFDSKLTIESNNKYHITVVFNEGFESYKGINNRQTVRSNGKKPFKVTFYESHYNQASYQGFPVDNKGQIPSLYFSKS